MESQLVYDDFLNHLGRMLLFRCESFQETSEISSVMTTDPQGYLTVNVPFVRQFFQESFLELVEEYVEKETVPSQPHLLERFQSRPILCAENPIERYYRQHHSRRRARKQQQAFLLAVAECFPFCLGAVRRNPANPTSEPSKLPTLGGMPSLVSAREAAGSLGVSEKTIRSWAREGKIRAKFKTRRKGKKRLLGIPRDALAEHLTVNRSLPN